MRKLLVLGGVLLIAPLVLGGELPPPTPRKDRPVADELWMRKVSQEWNSDVVTTTNPNGTIRCDKLGEHLLYNNGGSYKQCFCVAPPTTWRCDANALSAP